jgi:hypothetical protein
MNAPFAVPRRERGLAAALLFLLLAVVHWDVLFLGRSLVLTNHSNPLDYRALPQNYGGDLVAFEQWNNRNLWPYANIRDPGGTWWQWEPAGEFLRRSIELREWPFWDPYLAAGTPAMANLTPAFFFPPYAAIIALGGSVPLKNAYLLCMIWTAAFFTFLFLRRHGLLFVSSFGGAAALIVGGAVNQNIGTILGQTASCLPICLYATRAFLDNPNGWKTVSLTLVYAGAALASFPPISLGVFGVTSFYALTSLMLEQRGDASRRALRLRRWILAIALSVGLVGFYYVPAIALREHTPNVLAFYEGVGFEAMPFSHIYQLLSPTLMGGPLVYLTSPVPAGDIPHLPYVGMSALLLVLLARPAADSRSAGLFYSSVLGSILILLKVFGLPPAQWLGHLPVLNQIHFAHYFGVPLGFLLAFLAAFGLESVLRESTTSIRVLIAVGAGFTAIESLWWVVEKYEVLKSAGDAYWVRDWRVVNAVGSVAAVTLIAGVLAPQWRRIAAVSLVTLVALEGIYNSSYPSPDAWNMFSHPVPYVQLLQREAARGRVLPFGALNANLNSAFEISSIDSLMPFNPPKVRTLYTRYTKSSQGLVMREAKEIPPEPVLDRANVRFLAVRDAFPDVVRAAQTRGYSVRFNDGYVWLFERPTLPRFFFSSEYRVLRAPSVLNAIAESPSREVLLESHPGFAPTPNAQADPDVRVESSHRNSVTLVVDAPRAGLLYAADSFFEGWTALVNGEPTRILPANYAFRAIAVAPGRSRVEFRYWPPGLTLGLAVSGASAVLLLGFAAVTLRTKRHDQ